MEKLNIDLASALAARAEFDESNGHTVVMTGRTLAPQDAFPQAPRPQAEPQAIAAPPAPQAPPAATSKGKKKGRARSVDTTDIAQLPVIARRVARAYLLEDGEYHRISKPAALAIVKYLEFLGKPVEKVNLATAEDGVEVLVFG